MAEQLSCDCDECGRKMEKAHRVYAGARYCGTCYARVFVKKSCSQCNEECRLPKNIENAVCSKCEKNKPCCRCGKVDFAVGKITPYGPVCNSCSVYFREARPCAACGTQSSRLSVVKRRGIDVQICPRCARADFKSCDKCGRHRLLQEDGSGLFVCRKCNENGYTKCKSCEQEIPAGKGSRCDSCYWAATLQKRIKLNAAAFTTVIMANHFERFGNWLSIRVGNHKAALTINHFLSAFQDVERRWGFFPTYEVLLETFKQDFFRNKKPMLEWLENVGLLIVDTEVKEQHLDKKLIEKSINSFPESSAAADVLRRYSNYLHRKISAGKTSVRSVRLALRPAAALLQLGVEMQCDFPHQSLLDEYLIRSPGQMAAVTGFINFINREFQLNLSPRIDRIKTSEMRKKNLEKKLMTFIKDKKDLRTHKPWIRLCLEYFHDFQKSDLQRLSMDGVTANADGSFTAIIDDKNYWIPALQNSLRYGHE